MLNADSNGDILWVNGDGTSAAFTRNSDGTYTSPPDDFGTLVENDDHSFTYTAPDQTLYQFNALGLLKSVEDPDGLESTYDYTDQGQLSQVMASDGGVTNFTYNPDTLLLETITEPGDREWTFDHDDGNLTEITAPGTGDNDAHSATTATAA